MLASLFDDIKYLLRARNNVVAMWPKSYYRKELITVRLPTRLMFIVNNPAGVQHVMVSNEQNYRKSPLNSQTLKPLLGNGLFVSNGELWARQRKITAPSTHGSRLPEYAKTIIACGQGMIADWRALPPGHVVEVTEPFTLVTAEIISQLMFGFPLQERGQVLYHAFKEYSASHGRVHLFEVLGLPSGLPRPGGWRGRRAVRRFDRVLLDILKAGQARDPQSPPTLLDMLINYRDPQGQPMAPDLMRDEMASIFLAGHETTALTLGWAFFLLSQHPEVEQRVHEEIDRVLGDRAVGFEDVPQLTYARAVIDETLRLYPPVHIFSREAIGDDVISGQRVPAGSYITIASWLLHRHEKYWEEPKAFRPERFLPPQAQKLQHFAYIPFGTGSRVCMGKHLGLLEVTLLFALVAQSFRLRVPEGVVIEPLGRMTLRPSPAMPLRLERRR